jgi:hypothetical protein
VKAVGGIRDLDMLLAVRAIGVCRAGATRTAAMLEDCRKRLVLQPISNREPLKEYEKSPALRPGFSVSK